MEKFITTKNSVMKIQNVGVNYESRPVKWNSERYEEFKQANLFISQF